jgi:pimeloyl-ACP methyl ester carboxylesterase
MPFTQNEQTTLWYTDRGSGPPVLLVHGGLFDPINGQRFWELPGVVDQLVARGYRVLVPDRRYSVGQTSTPFDIYSWEKEATDFAAVLRAANVESASVVAGSNGCSAAIRFALASSTLVRTLVLCWPVTPKNDWLRQDLDRCATLVEQIGPTMYLKRLREQGVARPGEERSGFSFGFALLHDAQLAASFCSFPALDAARTMRASSQALLSGNVLRGVSTTHTALLARQPFPIWVMPALPETPVHTLEIAQKLTGHLTGVRLLPGFPETPTPRFAAVRTEFCTVLQQALEDPSSQG